MSIQLRDGLLNQQVDLVLEDLLVRFLINVPEEDLSSIERVFFQVEEAQWFYTDFVRVLNPYLPPMKMKSFAPKFLEKCPLIWKWGNPADAIQRFGKYKSVIPVRGVALFNKDLSRVVLVKGTESSTWSFPRGKISKDESDIDCAIREVEEETGYNAKGQINENDVIERTIRGKNYKIYLVKNVPEDYNFQPLARNEISKIEWFDIKTIQKKNKNSPNSFFIVGTVLKPLLKWINKNKEGGLTEDEIMRNAEIRLKSLLGIGSESENVDAGRELLNILQKVTATNVPSEAANYNVPQNLLQNQIPGNYPFFQPQPHGHPPNPHHIQLQHHLQPHPSGPPQPPYFPYQFNPVPPNSQQLYQQPNSQYDPGHLTSPPNPQTLSKPSNRNPADSRELLSILNKPKKEVTNDENKKSNSQNLLSLLNNKEEITSDNAKQTILNILNKKKHAPEENASQTLMNILNKKKDSTGKDSEENASHTLLNLLNSKKNVKADDETPSKTLMNILNSKREPTTSQYSQSHQPSNELEESIRFNGGRANAEPGKKLTLLKRKSETPDTADSEAQIRSPKEKNQSSSKELLSLLRGPRVSPKEPVKKEKELKQDIPKVNTTNASHELLGLLNRKPSHPVETPQSPKPSNIESTETENHDDFDNFEDFEDFGGLNEGFLGKSSYHNFDIASDEEDVDHLLDDIASPFVSQSSAVPEQSFSKPPDFYHKQEPKKNKIRLLKPGEPLNGVFQNTSESQSHYSSPTLAQDTYNSNSQGQSLLDLLNSKKSPEIGQDPRLASHLFQPSYGVPSPSIGTSPISLGEPNANSSEVLKDLLWKRN